jgi:signal transduction histidine kinase
MLRRFSASSRSPTAPARPSSPSAPGSWISRLAPPGVRFSWLRWAHVPLALLGIAWVEPAAWARYLVVTAVLTLEWPFCIRLTQGVEVYMPVMWTSAAAAYVVGPAILPVFWIAAPLGFALIVLLDGAGLVPAVGLAAESAKRYRGEPFALDSVADGDIRHSLMLSEHAVRVTAIAACRAYALALPATILIAETATFTWRMLAPIPGRMAPARTWVRIAQALGPDMPLATLLLHGVMVGYLVVAWEGSGMLGFAVASLSTLTLHAILKRLNDTRLESERRREELVSAQDELDRRQRLAAIGQTAATVFHQVSRHHGAIGMYAHLLGRGADPAAAREHAARILASVDDANRVIEELLRFGQDRALNLYPHSVGELIQECVAECAPRAASRDVALVVADAPDVVVALDKHKVKQAIGNLLDNAVAASRPGMHVEVASSATDGVVRVMVRDHGPGIAPEIRTRLFTPFATTKADGIGLGLVLARDLVEAHGGSLEWQAAEPGTAFVIELPRDR